MDLNEITLFLIFSAVMSSCTSSKFMPFNDNAYVIICSNDDANGSRHDFKAKNTVFIPYGNGTFSFYNHGLHPRHLLKGNCKRIPKILMGFKKIYLNKFRKLFRANEELEGGKLMYCSSKAR
ncbi:hypothetical protein X975_12399, partial [Stegodyphus mimosarum]